MRTPHENATLLQQRLNELELENQLLKNLLSRAGISYAQELGRLHAPELGRLHAPEPAAFYPDQGARIKHPDIITEKMANIFYSWFWGRQDVYAKRSEKKNGEAGYYPQCWNFWKDICPRKHGQKVRCSECAYRDHKPLMKKDILAHLQGRSPNASDVIGVYPLLTNGTCRFMVYDFDNHEPDAEKRDYANTDDTWMEEVEAMRAICIMNGIDPLVERSRSGKGAHIWLFFDSPMPAKLVRRFGIALLEKGAEQVNLKSFKYYDRMLPMQDALPAGGLGNLIALPLQGKALQGGNSAFIDRNWNAYPNQWEVLCSKPRLSREFLEMKIQEWSAAAALDFDLSGAALGAANQNTISPGAAGRETINSESDNSRVTDQNTAARKAAANEVASRNIAAVREATARNIATREKPWQARKQFSPNDVDGSIRITLSNGIYVDSLNLKPAIQNQIRRMAAISNPVFYQNERIGTSNFNTPRWIYLGQDHPSGYIQIPRGLLDELIERITEAGPQCPQDERTGRSTKAGPQSPQVDRIEWSAKAGPPYPQDELIKKTTEAGPQYPHEERIGRSPEAGISYQIEDERQAGRRINVTFTGTLREEQKPALEAMSKHDTGILHAATAFGKTVVCSALIAEKQVNTLIILESSALIEQWEAALNQFLVIDEECPEYKTKSGRTKRRKSVIGRLQGAHDSMTGIIDIAMAGSLRKKGEFHPLLKQYGLVLVDECHHAASETIAAVLKEVTAKYVYGVTATPNRGDGLEKINYMLLGPIRYRYTAKEKAKAQGIAHLVYPRFTRTVPPRGVTNGKMHPNEAYEIIRNNELRDEQIAEDVRRCVESGRTPVILSKYRDHTERLYERIKNYADHVFLMTGNNSKREHKRILEEMRAVPPSESIILAATGKLIGEGFDYPRLDTLIMATPVSFKGVVEQYAGRLNRDYEGKRNVIVYDYVDSHIPMFDNMYAKRLKAYKQIGYDICAGLQGERLSADAAITELQGERMASGAAISGLQGERMAGDAIFTNENYQEAYRKDLLAATKHIVISSPAISGAKIHELIALLTEQQQKGVTVTVVTWAPDAYDYGDAAYWMQLHEEMRQAGFYIRLVEEFCVHFAIIDSKTVWYGNMNLLGKERAEDSMMRVESKRIAEELMGMVC